MLKDLQADKALFKRIYKTPKGKKFDAALDFVLNYNGEKEHVKVLKTYTVGVKNRVITEPTVEYKEVLKNFAIVIKYILGMAGESHMFSLRKTWTAGVLVTLPVRDTKSLMAQLDSTSKIQVKDNLIRVKFDVQDAFGTTSYRTLYKILSRRTKTVVAWEIMNKMKYLFIDDKLPQGFSTSSIIFNYIQYHIIDKLGTYLGKASSKTTKGHCKYCYNFYNKVSPTKLVYIARYADDYLMGLTADPVECKKHYYVLYYLLNRLFKRYGYKLNQSKFQVNHKFNNDYIRFLGHSITGNNVKNEHTIPYKAIHRYKNIRHNLFISNIGNVSDSTITYSLGYLAYLKSVRTR